MRKLNNHLKAIVSLVLAMSLLLLLNVGSLAIDEETTTVTVRQTIIKGNPDPQKYEYALVPDEAENPMPKGTENEKYIFALDGEDQIKTDLTFTRPGVYEYKIGRVGEGDEFDSSAAVHNFGVLVKNDGNGGLTATVYTCHDNQLQVLEDGVVAVYELQAEEPLEEPTTNAPVTNHGTNGTGSTGGGTTIKAHSPNTNDPYQLSLYAICAGAALIGFFLMFFLRRKNDEEEEEM